MKAAEIREALGAAAVKAAALRPTYQEQHSAIEQLKVTALGEIAAQLAELNDQLRAVTADNDGTGRYTALAITTKHGESVAIER